MIKLVYEWNGNNLRNRTKMIFPMISIYRMSFYTVLFHTTIIWMDLLNTFEINLYCHLPFPKKKPLILSFVQVRYLLNN